jgi:hypothetical protein
MDDNWVNITAVPAIFTLVIISPVPKLLPVVETVLGHSRRAGQSWCNFILGTTFPNRLLPARNLSWAKVSGSLNLPEIWRSPPWVATYSFEALTMGTEQLEG